MVIYLESREYTYAQFTIMTYYVYCVCTSRRMQHYKRNLQSVDSF